MNTTDFPFPRFLFLTTGGGVYPLPLFYFFMASLHWQLGCLYLDEVLAPGQCLKAPGEQEERRWEDGGNILY